MDWKLKPHSWDFAQFQQEGIPNMDALYVSSGINHSQRNNNTGEFLVDLKLGQMGNSSSGDEPQDKWKETTGPKTASPSKRARAANGGILPVSCLVDGCDSDLINCRDYHRRHKVCERHSKTPEVTIVGQKKRFCQQCSRFHSLEEFDEEKRSCRKRLDGHNRRRRKAQPEPQLHSGSYISRYRGLEMPPFSSTPMYAANAMASSTWPGHTSANEEARVHHDHHKQQQLQLPEKQCLFFGSSTSSSFGAGTQFTFLQGNGSFPGPQMSYAAGSSSASCQAHPKSVASSECGVVCSNHHHTFLSDGLLDQVPDSPRAPSLLSVPRTKASGISLSSVLPHSPAPIEQPSFPSIQYNSSLDLMDSVSVAHSNGADVHCEGMFRIESGESPNNKVPETIPFYWE